MVRCYYEGVGIDMFFPSTEYMNEIIQRAIALPLSNHTCQIVDINDLVVMKGIFGRSKDLVDIESLARYGARSIDLNFVEKHISEIMHPSNAVVHIGHVRRAIEKGLLERQDADAYTESITQDNSPEQKCASTPKP